MLNFRRSNLSDWIDIETQRGFKGSYMVEGGFITVKSGDKLKTTQVGNVFPQTLAKMLLFELERDL
jgi:hypothetical protein